MIWPHVIAMQMTPGSAWRPSNMAEAELFHAGMCVHCDHREADKFGCVIMELAAIYQAHETGYPRELKINAQGQPVCTSFECTDLLGSPRCERTSDLFEGA